MDRSTDDSELIRRCKAGDSRAFEPLVRAYEGPALRVAVGVLGDADEARDAVQDAFMRAFRSLDRFQIDRPFLPWLLSILRNRCRDLLRTRKPRFGLEVLDSRAMHSYSDPEAQQRSAHAHELIWRALERISADHREVIVLKELEGLNYAEIAAATGIPEGTVASRLYHARRALRSALERLGESGAATEVRR